MLFPKYSLLLSLLEPNYAVYTRPLVVSNLAHDYVRVMVAHARPKTKNDEHSHLLWDAIRPLPNHLS